jgi:hypothetical protein
MALSPIQMFANPSSQGLLGILSGSQNALTLGLQSAIQIGRDLSNKAVQQERDFARERRSLDMLDQRRAENALSQQNRDREFGRLTANDIFSQEMQRDQFSQGVARDEFSRDMQEDRFRLDRTQEDRMAKESQFRMDETKRTEEFNQGLLTPNDIFGPQLPDDPFVTREEADMRIAAGTRAKNPEAVREAVRAKAQAEAEIARRRAAEGEGPDATKPLSPAEMRNQAKYEQSVLDREASELIADTEAFAPQSQFLETAADGKSYKDPKAASAAALFDKDRLASERSVATSVSRDEYVKRGGGISEEKRKRRARFWDIVNKKTSAAAPSTSAPPSSGGGYVTGALKGLE